MPQVSWRNSPVTSYYTVQKLKAISLSCIDILQFLTFSTTWHGMSERFALWRDVRCYDWHLSIFLLLSICEAFSRRKSSRTSFIPTQAITCLSAFFTFRSEHELAVIEMNFQPCFIYDLLRKVFACAVIFEI